MEVWVARDEFGLWIFEERPQWNAERSIWHAFGRINDVEMDGWIADEESLCPQFEVALHEAVPAYLVLFSRDTKLDTSKS